MKKDVSIALAAIIAVAAITFGLAAMRPPFAPTTSSPFTSAPVGKTPTAYVVLRVNGEAITQDEFEASFEQMPDDMKRQFSSAPGRQAFAEQFIRIKVLEQEGRRIGVDRNPRVEGQIAAARTGLIANAAAEKMVANPTKETVQSFYAKNKSKFETIDVSHILIAYQGTPVPARGNTQPPPKEVAIKRAEAIYAQLKAGADFATIARRVSDDSSTAGEGGRIGSFGHDQLPAELEGVVFAMKAGETSKPVVSRFGVHIFRMNNRGTAALGEVSNRISRQVKTQNTFDRIELLRRNAKIHFDPKYFPEAKSWPSNQRKNPS